MVSATLRLNWIEFWFENKKRRNLVMAGKEEVKQLGMLCFKVCPLHILPFLVFGVLFSCGEGIWIWIEWLIETPIALGTWVFSVAGALIAIPVGIKRKSLAPLVFFGTTGTMLDIIMGISACEREHAERQMKLLEAQNTAAADAVTES
ncbi:UNVERIFIED_CONTAM: hypothetical protein Sangu_1954500 [Sesamum angustifolium]|uniref:Uncharacterized protein n=1 Tax=Sesamum angustifolium TaxID=2727405 RepID=A0AAW2LYW5_9LAMI